MNYNNPKYYYDIFGTIQGICVDYNNIKFYIPINSDNTDYQNIMKKVESGKLTISTEDDPNLNIQK